MTFLQIKVLDGHKAAFIFEDSANATHTLERGSPGQGGPVKMMFCQKLGAGAMQGLSQEICSCLINPLQISIQNILPKLNIRI